MNTTKGQLGVYHLMIVSKYFKTIDDYINLELSTIKAKGNMEKFHYNPISLDKWSRKFFTSLETLHVYNKRDYHFTNETFFKRIYWYGVDYEEWKNGLGQKKENIEHKIITLMRASRKREEFTSGSFGGKRHLIIPDGINTIGKKALGYSEGNCGIVSITIPDSVTSIEDGNFSCFYGVTSIRLSTNLKRIGNKCFIEPRSLKELVIPDSVTSIGGGF